MQLTQHPLSAAFPGMTAEEFSEFRIDVAANGVREPIVIYQSMVLDGWHRYTAAAAAGLPCPSSLLPEGTDPVAFVLSRNLHRRHLTPSQRAFAVVECSAWVKHGANQHSQGGSVPGSDPRTEAQMAAEASVSVKTIERAKVVVEKGDDETREAVRTGKMGLKTAAEKAAPAKKGKTKAKTKKKAEPKQAAAKPTLVEPTPVDPEDDLVAMLEELQQEVASLTALVKAAEADDQKAETIKWRRAYDNAGRQQSEAMDRAKSATEREAWTMRQLRRCGKAIGEDDPTKIAAAVEAFVRQHKPIQAAAA